MCVYKARLSYMETLVKEKGTHTHTHTHTHIQGATVVYRDAGTGERDGKGRAHLRLACARAPGQSRDSELN